MKSQFIEMNWLLYMEISLIKLSHGLDF